MKSTTKPLALGGISTRRPETTQEFAVLVPDKESQATEINAAQGHMDLITVLMRQLRVALGSRN